MLHGALVIDMVNNSVGESKTNFSRLRKAWNVLIEIIEILVVKNISPLKFAKYLSYSEVPKNMNVANN